MLVVLRAGIGLSFPVRRDLEDPPSRPVRGRDRGLPLRARGPVAGLFYRMVPDIDGHQRLEANLTEVEVKNARGARRDEELQAGQVVGRPAAAVCRFLPPHDTRTTQASCTSSSAEEAQKVYDRHIKA